MKRIVISYFPVGLKYATVLLFGCAIYLALVGYPIWTVPLSLLGIIILTTNYVTEIDSVKKEYRDFISVIWMPFEEIKVKFVKADKIIIQKENHSQMLNSRSRSRQLDWSSFTGTLILDGNNTIELLTKNDKGELIKGLKEFADFLNVEIEDQSTGRHYIVDVYAVG
ncbi:hypothetical protein BH09BAC3_BH09BAC3_09260 [soil metagenome]